MGVICGTTSEIKAILYQHIVRSAVTCSRPAYIEIEMEIQTQVIDNINGRRERQDRDRLSCYWVDGGCKTDETISSAGVGTYEI